MAWPSRAPSASPFIFHFLLSCPARDPKRQTPAPSPMTASPPRTETQDPRPLKTLPTEAAVLSASPFLIFNSTFLIFIAPVLPRSLKKLIPPEGETLTFFKKSENSHIGCKNWLKSWSRPPVSRFSFSLFNFGALRQPEKLPNHQSPACSPPVSRRESALITMH